MYHEAGGQVQEISDTVAEPRTHFPPKVPTLHPTPPQLQEKNKRLSRLITLAAQISS